MYNYRPTRRTGLKVNQGTEGETIETRVEGIVHGGQPVDEGTELLYSQRKDGVLPESNIRTDKWEIAIEAHDYADKTHKAKREERHKPKEEAPKAETGEGGETPTPDGGGKV